MVTLLAVDPIRVPKDASQRPYYVQCDLCEKCAADDIWAGKQDESQWRLFFEVVGEYGLVVCERCLPRLDEGAP